MAKRTPAQRERQDSQHRDGGKYAKVNPCYLCGKSAGVNYSSDRRTDTTDSAGNDWGDIALVLCARCAKKLDAMPDAEAYALMLGDDDSSPEMLPAFSADTRYAVYAWIPSKNDWELQRENLTPNAADVVVLKLTELGWKVDARITVKG